MTDYTVISRFRNKEEGERLVKEIQKKGKTCYNFWLKPGDPNNPSNHPEEQMKVMESTKDFYNSEQFKTYFKKDLEGLRSSNLVASTRSDFLLKLNN